MKKFSLAMEMMMGMCMCTCQMCMAFRVLISDMFSNPKGIAFSA